MLNFEVEVTYSITIKKTIKAKNGNEASSIAQSKFISCYGHLVHKDLPGHSSKISVKCRNLEKR